MRIRRICLCMALVAATVVEAQDSPVTRSDNSLLEQARYYFDGGDYAVAADYLQKWTGTGRSSALNSLDREETDYMNAVIAAEANPVEGLAALAGFEDKYPESEWGNRINALMGISLAMSGEYDAALERFEKCDVEDLSLQDSRSLTFCRALSLIRQGHIDEGRIYLNVLDNLGGYDEEVRFYRAYTDYSLGNLDAAYNGFSGSFINRKYYDWSRLYTAEILLKQGDKAKARTIARGLAEGGSEASLRSEAERVLGEAGYADGNWREASELLTSYVASNPDPERLDLYQLGMAEWELGHYDRAAGFLHRVTDEDDVIGQSAWLHIGLASLEMKDNQSAVFAFERASSMDADRELTEQALLNYAMCAGESGYSPFAEPVTAFERFMNEFPDSRYREQASSRLVNVYLQSGNYDAALESIAKIKNPDSEILSARQQLLFRKGTDLFADGRYDEAAECMTEVIGMSGYGRQIAAEASFWRGEVCYRQEKYKSALKDYRNYMSQTSSDDLYGLALYGSGYASYRESDWGNALDNWKKLSGKYSGKVSKEVLADAQARMGDCHFYRRDYADAIQCYDKSISIYGEGGDYAMFRKALCLGLRKDYRGKAAEMEKLCQEYPTSAYCAQALYEEGRSYQQIDNTGEAVDVFRRLAAKYPDSDFARKALAETALIHFQNDDYDKAIPAYKEVIAKYPGSVEAEMAMRDLRSVYVETGRVDDYIAYAGSVSGFAPVRGDEKDSLTYVSAEMLFTRGSYKQAQSAFEGYLSQYDKGAYRVNASYYLGLVYERDGEKDKALECFSEVAVNENSSYCTEALSHISELAYGLGEYSMAEEAYKKLYRRAGTAEQTRSSLLGVVRSAFKAGDSAAVVEYADKALSARPDPSQETEIRYDKAKSLQSLGRGDEALAEYSRLGGDARSAYGAESSYIASQMLFDRGEREAAEKNVMTLAQSGSPHSYWLARSLVLLSDIYSSEGKTIEAKQYLLSLKQNYNESDDIAAMIEDRLQALDK